MDSAREKILHYMISKLKSYHNVVLLHNLSVENVRAVIPAFEDLCKDLVALEVDFVKSILKEGIKSGEFRSCDIGKVAQGIIDISTMTEFSTLKNFHMQPLSKKNLNDVEKRVQFMVSIVLDGIKK